MRNRPYFSPTEGGGDESKATQLGTPIQLQRSHELDEFLLSLELTGEIPAATGTNFTIEPLKEDIQPDQEISGENGYFIQKAPLLKGLPTEDLNTISEASTLVKIEPEKTLAKKGYYIATQAAVLSIQRNGTDVNAHFTVKPGAGVGEFAAIGLGRTATLKLTGQVSTDFVFIPEEDLKKLSIISQNILLENAIRASQHLANTNKWIEENTRLATILKSGKVEFTPPTAQPSTIDPVFREFGGETEPLIENQKIESREGNITLNIDPNGGIVRIETYEEQVLALLPNQTFMGEFSALGMPKTAEMVAQPGEGQHQMLIMHIPIPTPEYPKERQKALTALAHAVRDKVADAAEFHMAIEKGLNAILEGNEDNEGSGLTLHEKTGGIFTLAGEEL